MKQVSLGFNGVGGSGFFGVIVQPSVTVHTMVSSSYVLVLEVSRLLFQTIFPPLNRYRSSHINLFEVFQVPKIRLVRHAMSVRLSFVLSFRRLGVCVYDFCYLPNFDFTETAAQNINSRVQNMSTETIAWLL